MSAAEAAQAIQGRLAGLENLTLITDPNKGRPEASPTYAILREMNPGEEEPVAGGSRSQLRRAYGDALVEIGVIRGHGWSRALGIADEIRPRFIDDPEAEGGVTFRAFEVFQGDPTDTHFIIYARVEYSREFRRSAPP